MNIRHEFVPCKGLGEFTIVFNGASGIETPGYRGISHLIEHCMCEDVKKIESTIQEYGLSWNAYTSNNEVAFFLTGLTKNISLVMNTFMKMILNYKIPNEVFEREKKVVLTEYNMAASEQFGAFSINFNRIYYNSFDPIGYKEDIKNITYDQFIEFKNKWFSNPSYIIISTHKDDKNLTLDKINVDDLTFNNIKRFSRNYELSKYNNPIEVNSEFNSQRVLNVSTEFFSYPIYNYDSFTYSIILKNLLTNGLTSILMKHIREQLGYVYSISSSIEHLTECKFLFTIFTAAEDDKIEIVLNKLKYILTHLDQFITRELYESNIIKIKSKIETSECIRYTSPLDDAIVMNRITFTNPEKIKELKSNFNEFMSFVTSLNFNNAIYCLDNSFGDKNDK